MNKKDKNKIIKGAQQVEALIANSTDRYQDDGKTLAFYAGLNLVRAKIADIQKKMDPDRIRILKEMGHYPPPYVKGMDEVEDLKRELADVKKKYRDLKKAVSNANKKLAWDEAFKIELSDYVDRLHTKTKRCNSKIRRK